MSLKTRLIYVCIITMIIAMGTLFQPDTVSAALTANVTANKSVQLNWSGTGSSPYTLYRGSTQIYNGTATSYTDSGLPGGNYNYQLNYQNYELITPGYTQSSSYWGITKPATTGTRNEWKIISAGHWRYYTEYVAWCEWTSPSGLNYSHAPPCVDEYNSTTKAESRREWIDDQYGWVPVPYSIPAEYGWIDNSYWVSAVYGYVTRSTTISAIIPATPDIQEIVAPTVNQVFGGIGPSLSPIVKVIDPNGDTLSIAYYIDNETSPRETRSASNTSTAQTISFNAVNIANLAEGAHSLRFTVSDGTLTAQKSINVKVDKSVPVLGTVSVASTPTSIDIAGSGTDAVAGMAAAPYRFNVGGVASNWTNVTTYTRTGLTPNTLYTTTFEAKDKLDLIAVKTQNIYTKAQTPTATITNSTESALSIQLNDSNPATTLYQIKAGTQYVSATGILVSVPTWITLVNKQITLNSLAANTGYSIQAQAKNKEETLTTWSAAVVGTTKAVPPTTITTAETQTSITVNWPASSLATGYDIEADGTVTNNGTATSYTHTNLQPESAHKYRIRVRNAGGIGNWSSMFTKFTLPNPPASPSNISISAIQTEVTISWDSTANTVGYEIEADGNIVELGNQITYTHTGLEAVSQHSYRIRARNTGGASEWSLPVSITTLPFPPDTPENLSAVLSIHSVNVSWEAMERAVAYEIEVDGFIIDNDSETAFLHEGLEALSGHTYRVRAKNTGGKSAWSVPLNVTTHPEKPVVPASIMTMSDETTITVMWYQVPHADNYEIEIDDDTIESVTDTSFVHTGLQSDSPHQYRVRTKNISGYSEWSAPLMMATLPIINQSSDVSLMNITAVVTNTFITLSWDTIAPEAEYVVERDGANYDNGKDTIFHDDGLSAGEFHTYKIRVKDDGELGNWIAVLSLTTLPNPPDVPTEVEAIAATNSIELRWTKVNGATGYDIEIDGETFSIEDISSYLHEDLMAGTGHSYRIRAKNMTGVTAWSPAIQKSTTSPTYIVRIQYGQPFDLTLLANHVQDFSELAYVVTYDPSQIEVIDLYNFTPLEDTISNGKIPGSNLIVQYEPGRIVISKAQNIVPGTSWSGELTTIAFKSKVNGEAFIDVIVE
jgi:hypothetical protein